MPAGNSTLNDKPTGAVVGQQPFGGEGRSGTRRNSAGSPAEPSYRLAERQDREGTLVPGLLITVILS